MRPAAVAALLLISGASCTSTPTATVYRNGTDAGFRLVEAPRAASPAKELPSAEIRPVGGLVATEAEVAPANWQEAPPAPPPLEGEEAVDSPAMTPPVPLAAGALTLEAALGMAFAANPTIGEAEYAVRRSQGEWTQVGLSPNPIVGYMASEVGQEDQLGQQGIYAQQSIPLGNKLALNRAVSSGDIAAARAIAEAQRLRVRSDVQARFYEALGAQELVEIAERTEANAERSLEATRRLEEAAEASRADVLLAEAAFERSGVSRQEAEARARGAWRQLAAMLGRPELAPIPLAGELETDRRPEEFEALWQRVRGVSPELQEASARIARARARIAREHAANIPDVDAQLGIQHDQATNYTVGTAQIGFMLPVHQRNQGAIAAARAEYCRQVKEFERLELNLRDRLAAAVRDAEVAAQQVETFGGKVVPAAEEGLNLIREGYDRGEFDVLRLVNTQQVYADALRDYVQAQIDLQRALAMLDGVLLTGGLDQPGEPQGTDTPDSLTEIPKAQ